MNPAGKQLYQWPPTVSTVVGLAGVIGMVLDQATGNHWWGGLGTAVSLILLPQAPPRS